jgi:hypothetical protein
MEVLDYIDIATTDPDHVAQAVVRYIQEHGDMINSLDVKVRVSICRSPQTIRASKSDRQSTLQQLISASGISVWHAGLYRFDFTKGQYLAGSQELYVTAGEAVAMYQKLVRKQHSITWAAFFSNLKRKHGNDFLKDFV